MNSLQDLENYEAYIDDPLVIDFQNYRIYVPPPPSSGVVFAFIFNIMANFLENQMLNFNDEVDFYHKLIEAFKFAYAKEV